MKKSNGRELNLSQIFHLTKGCGTISDKTTQNIMDEVNNLVNKHFPELMRRSPRYKYYEDNKKNRYFYTTEKINCGCKRKPELGHYVCGKYTYKKGKKMYVLTKKKCFAKKHRAIEWARKESGKAIERQTKNRE